MKLIRNNSLFSSFVLAINQSKLDNLSKNARDVLNNRFPGNEELVEQTISIVSGYKSNNDNFDMRQERIAWLFSNVALIHGISELQSACSMIDNFDKLDKSLKPTNGSLPASYQELKDLIQNKKQVILKNKATNISSFLPVSILDMISTMRSYIPRNGDQASDLKDIQNWMTTQFLIRFRSKINFMTGAFSNWKELFNDGRPLEQIPDFDADLYIRNPDIVKNKEAKNAKEAEDEILKDKNDYLGYVYDYMTIKHKLLGEVPPLSSFSELSKLKYFVDTNMSQEEKDKRYIIPSEKIINVDPFTNQTLDKITEGRFTAIKIKEWSPYIRDELCKRANWCIRRESDFDKYVNERNKIYLILDGNKQIALMDFQNRSIRNVNNSPISEELAAYLFPIFKKLSDVENSYTLPFGNDFNAFNNVPEFLNEQIQSAKDSSLSDINFFCNQIEFLEGLKNEKANNEVEDIILNKKDYILDIVGENKPDELKIKLLILLARYDPSSFDDIKKCCLYLYENTTDFKLKCPYGTNMVLLGIKSAISVANDLVSEYKDDISNIVSSNLELDGYNGYMLKITNRIIKISTDDVSSVTNEIKKQASILLNQKSKTASWINNNCRFADVLPQSDKTENQIIDQQGENVKNISAGIPLDIVKEIEKDYGNLSFLNNGSYGVVYRNKNKPGWLIKITKHEAEMDAIEKFRGINLPCLVSYGRSKVYKNEFGVKVGLIETKEVPRLSNDEAFCFDYTLDFFKNLNKFGGGWDNFIEYLYYLEGKHTIKPDVFTMDFWREIYWKAEALLECLDSNGMEHWDIRSDNIGIESDGRYVIFDFGGLMKKN